MAEMHDGDVVLLENVRFYAGEEENDLAFAEKLAHGFDVFVNDAFAVSHRAHASTVGVTKFLPSYAGLLLSSEIENLFIAGRCASLDAAALASVRVMPQCMCMGEAAGTAAALALENGVLPRDVDVSILRERLLKNGAILTMAQVESTPVNE